MSKTINSEMRITLYADHDYKYTVFAGYEYGIVYLDILDNKRELTFGSLDEMEAVAKTMLKVVKLAKENDE